MNDSIKQKVLRIVLDGGFIWYDVMVEEDFNFVGFMDKCAMAHSVYFQNDSIELFIPWHQLKSMFTFYATQPTKLNVVNFPGQPT